MTARVNMAFSRPQNYYSLHRTRAHALHTVTYILIIWDHALFGSVPRAFALIDTVYRDLTGPVVHTLCTLPTP